MPSAVLAVVIACAAFTANKNPPSGTPATVKATGQAKIDRGEYYLGTLEDTTADVQLVAANRNHRVTPLGPHDQIDLIANIRGLDGIDYHVDTKVPIVDDPLGRHTTWWGVGIDVSHHGRSGIGSDRLPPHQSRRRDLRPRNAQRRRQTNRDRRASSPHDLQRRFTWARRT